MTDKWLKQIVSNHTRTIRLNPTSLLLDGKSDSFAQTLYTKLSQIDKHAFSYWGVSAHGSLPDAEGLYLRIDGPMFRGVVKIKSNQYDLFDIEIIKQPHNQVVDKLESVHLEDIPRKLDTYLK